MWSSAVSETVKRFLAVNCSDAEHPDSSVETEIRVPLTAKQYHVLRERLVREFAVAAQTDTAIACFSNNRRALYSKDGDMQAEVKTVLHSKVLPVKRTKAVIVQSLEKKLSEEEGHSLFESAFPQTFSPEKFKQSVRFLGHFTTETQVPYSEIQQFVETHADQLIWVPLFSDRHKQTFTNRAGSLSIKNIDVALPSGSIVLIKEANDERDSAVKIGAVEEAILVRYRTRISFTNKAHDLSLNVTIDLNRTKEVRPNTGQTKTVYSVEIEFLPGIVSAEAILPITERVFSYL